MIAPPDEIMICRTRRASFLIVLSGRVKKTGACSRTSTRVSMAWNGGQLLSACWRVLVNGLVRLSPFSTGGGFSGPIPREPVAGAPVLIAPPSCMLECSLALRERPSRIHRCRSHDSRHAG